LMRGKFDYRSIAASPINSNINSFFVCLALFFFILTVLMPSTLALECQVQNLTVESEDCDSTQTFYHNIFSGALPDNDVIIKEADQWNKDLSQSYRDFTLSENSATKRYMLYKKALSEHTNLVAKLDESLTIAFDLPKDISRQSCALQSVAKVNENSSSVLKLLHVSDCNLWLKVDLVYYRTAAIRDVFSQTVIKRNKNDPYYVLYSNLMKKTPRQTFRNIAEDEDKQLIWYDLTLQSRMNEYEHLMTKLAIVTKAKHVQGNYELEGSAVLQNSEAILGKFVHEGKELSHGKFRMWVPALVDRYNMAYKYTTCETGHISFRSTEKCYQDCDQCKSDALTDKLIQGKSDHFFCATGMHKMSCEPAGCAFNPGFGTICGFCRNNMKYETCGNVIEMQFAETLVEVCLEYKDEVECKQVSLNQINMYHNNFKLAVSFSQTANKLKEKLYFIQNRKLYEGEIAQLLTKSSAFGHPQLLGDEVTSMVEEPKKRWDCHFLQPASIQVMQCWFDTYDQFKTLNEVPGDYKFGSSILEMKSASSVKIDFSLSLTEKDLIIQTEKNIIKMVSHNCEGCFLCNYGMFCNFTVTSKLSGTVPFSCDGIAIVDNFAHVITGPNLIKKHFYLNNDSSAIKCGFSGQLEVLTSVKVIKDTDFLTSSLNNKQSIGIHVFKNPVSEFFNNLMSFFGTGFTGMIAKYMILIISCIVVFFLFLLLLKLIFMCCLSLLKYSPRSIDVTRRNREFYNIISAADEQILDTSLRKRYKTDGMELD